MTLAAFATVAFVTFISLLVDRTYTATQYALLASIGTIGRTTLAASSGALLMVLAAIGDCSLHDNRGDGIAVTWLVMDVAA